MFRHLQLSEVRGGRIINVVVSMQVIKVSGTDGDGPHTGGSMSRDLKRLYFNEHIYM